MSSSREASRRLASTKGAPNSSHSHLFIFSTLIIVILALLQVAGASSQPKLVSISSAGINVPKRPGIIAGLNQLQLNARNSKQTASNSSASILAALSPSALLGGGGRAKQQTSATTTNSPLYLDRHQQELLAANPTIQTLTNSNLLTRSDVSSSSVSSSGATSGSFNSPQAANLIDGNHSGPSTKFGLVNSGQPAPVDGQQVTQQQQSYRGYSLIELEVKSEPDRRYVQELYGNLSAALNEQAQRPANSFATVSPYVDIDFWSFKCALNDQIDIMVSPKSRAFILNQLARARIKHRVKIDDIQAKLDAQQQQPIGSAQTISANGAGTGNGELSGRQSAFNQAAAGGEAAAAAAGRPKQFGTGSDQLLNGRQQKPDPFAGTANMNDSLFFDNYQRLADINQYLESVVARARDVARVQVIGRSSQGRYLRVLRLGYEQSDLDGSTGPIVGGRADAGAEMYQGGVAARDSNSHQDDALVARQQQPQQQPMVQNASTIVDQFFKRQQAVKKLGSIWLDGGTHAREWISPATVLYLSFRLADNHARCQRFFDHLQMVVNQQQVALSARSGRGTNSHSAVEQPLDADLLQGLNEINTSLLLSGGPNQQQQQLKPRARTELEQKLELLAKRPQEVASEHACDLDLEQLLRRYTFYIMPVLNPDGYEYSHTHNRLWRKTRSTSSHPIYRHFCLGADPNRNYDARHGSTGSSSHPCSQTYGGTTPFTEPETRHQSNFVYSHRDTLKMFISFHSYSQMILLPFSHSKQLAPDHKDLESVGQAAVKAIERTHGTQYRVGPSASILYTASGTASDWAYEKAGIKYSYTIELRDTGTYGFLLPRQQIIPTGEETFNGLLAMIGQMEKNDNLLSSKSLQLPGAGSNDNQANSSTSADLSSTAGFVHAPDLDQLRPFGRFRPKPAQLENAIDGSDTWATPEPKLPGVRNRGVAAPSASSANRIIEDEVVSMSEEEPDAGLAFEGEGELMEPTNNLSVESTLAGQSSDAAAESAAKLMGHIYAHSHTGAHAQSLLHDRVASELLGRQMSTASSSQAAAAARQRFAANQLSLSANGRSLINSPPAPVRTQSGQPRRETSRASA